MYLPSENYYESDYIWTRKPLNENSIETNSLNENRTNFCRVNVFACCRVIKYVKLFDSTQCRSFGSVNCEF